MSALSDAQDAAKTALDNLTEAAISDLTTKAAAYPITKIGDRPEASAQRLMVATIDAYFASEAGQAPAATLKTAIFAQRTIGGS